MVVRYKITWTPTVATVVCDLATGTGTPAIRLVQDGDANIYTAARIQPDPDALVVANRPEIARGVGALLCLSFGWHDLWGEHKPGCNPCARARTLRRYRGWTGRTSRAGATWTATSGGIFNTLTSYASVTDLMLLIPRWYARVLCGKRAWQLAGNCLKTELNRRSRDRLCQAIIDFVCSYISLHHDFEQTLDVNQCFPLRNESSLLLLRISSSHSVSTGRVTVTTIVIVADRRLCVGKRTPRCIEVCAG